MQHLLIIQELKQRIKKECNKKKEGKKAHSAIIQMIKTENDFARFYNKARKIGGIKNPSLYQKAMHWLLTRRIKKASENIRLTYFKQ